MELGVGGPGRTGVLGWGSVINRNAGPFCAGNWPGNPVRSDGPREKAQSGRKNREAESYRSQKQLGGGKTRFRNSGMKAFVNWGLKRREFRVRGRVRYVRKTTGKTGGTGPMPLTDKEQRPVFKYR